MAKEIPKKISNDLSENDLAALLLLTALLFGIWLRVTPAANAGFPMNDGGMFYSMIRDLRNNGYALPVFTSYNNLNIPYTYPPGAFYLAGMLADTFHLSDLTILLWLPALINILTLPAFALLAGELLNSRLKTALATFFYALMPLSMDWFLMGGGLTRGIGQLFLILTCWSAARLFICKKHALPLTILFGALVVLTHPESALLAVTSVGILWLFSKHKQETILYTLLAGAGVVLICSPWLIHVLRLHGSAPFAQALRTSGSALFLWASIFPFNFTQESGLALLAVLGLIGLFIQLGRKEYLLPAWVVIPFFINPRSSARAAILPLSMLAAISLLDVILPALRSQANAKNNNNLPANLFMGYILIYLLVGGYGLSERMTSDRLAEGERQAMEWVRQNTPMDSHFILLTGEAQLMRDPAQEWFPALTERRSQTTLQGWEWLQGDKFIHAIDGYRGLVNCLGQDLACVERETQKLGIDFDHIYIKKHGASIGSFFPGRGLISELGVTPGYRKIFENDTTVIFAWSK